MGERTTRSRLGLTATITIAVCAGLGAAGIVDKSGSYEASVVLDTATGVVKGGPVRVDGFKAGTVKDITVVGGDKAKVTFSLDEKFAPLHDGATATIGWKAVLSERQLEISDAAGKTKAEIPDGGQLRGTNVAPVEVADLLAALDAPTRTKLQGTLGALSSTLKGSEQDANATIASAGPALAQLSSVLKAVGTDGPAIKSLVSRLDELMTAIGRRDGDVKTMVSQLHQLTSQVATRREDLRTTLTKLPATLKTATETLDDVPATVDDVVPLLRDLQPASEKLDTTATRLRPLLQDARPLIDQLRPTLASAGTLLTTTPGLLDDTHSLLPQATSLVKAGQKPVEFLRPYTPEVTAFFSTWASAFANYDSNGNFARIFGQAGTTSFNENPGIVPPGVTYDPYPKPGEIVGQAWTDAEGSELR